MIGGKAIAIMVAIGVGLLVSAGGIYLYQQGSKLPLSAGQEAATVAGQPATPEPPEPQDGAQLEPPKLQTETTGAVRPEAETTAVPSFDVVLVEPSGEGVIAGRAAPGWQVSVQSGGAKVGAATADQQGEWSVVLEKPLPSGDNALTLKTISPDGTRALSSQESVRVAVGEAEQKIAPAPERAEAAKPAELKPQQAEAVPPVLALVEPQGAARALKAGAEEIKPVPPKPALVFKTVDYEDTGSETGTVTLSGTSEPGATISIFFDDEPLAIVRAGRDGNWRIVVEKRLGLGQHNFRAERLDATGGLAGRAVVAIERVPAQPKAPEVAVRASPGEAKPDEGPSAQVAAVDAAGGQTAQQQKDNAKVYVIRRGDTLWAIAKRYLGNGLLYTSIFQDNREVISNPNLIHPKQELTVPAP